MMSNTTRKEGDKMDFGKDVIMYGARPSIGPKCHTEYGDYKPSGGIGPKGDGGTELHHEGQWYLRVKSVGV
jgi:hypothetical protein